MNTSLVEGQVEAAVAVGLGCPDRIASHSMVACSVLPFALRFPLIGSDVMLKFARQAYHNRGILASTWVHFANAHVLS